MKNLEVCVQFTTKPTEARVAADKEAAARVEAGHFRLVLEEGSLFDMDPLEAGVLEASYATMRDALAGVKLLGCQKLGVTGCRVTKD